ncbi:Na/Pi symporter [Parvibaculum sp.]|uniref:Na/Pi cotransporter family protein n=1 Tax=Parvibaculum sp. TaxID=2024848 RepID=UPI002BA50B5D|nr:Na/Pi symporter [Parvibaculum sp.]HUD51399.1 Na/Pi symporter [Parvibaculum sp.]
MEMFADIFAGLGLFFVGVKLIGGNLKQLTGSWFRRLIEAATRNTTVSALVGILSGALTQSSNAITFISIGMVTAGLVDVGRIVPMVIWANVGTSALVLLSAIDVKLAVLFLLGATGVAYYFDIDRAPRFRHVLGAVLGLGLLFFGLELIKSGAMPLKSMDAVREFLSFAASSYVLAFLIGVVLTIVAQSSATVSIIAVTMANVGLLTIDQTIVVVIGASLGSGISIALLSTNLRGIGRQIAWMQVAVKLVGVIVVLPFFAVEMPGHVPGIKALVFALTSDGATAVALVYLLLQLVSAVLTTVFRDRIMAAIMRLSPPTDEEALSKPRYIYAEALDEPRAALDLVEREQVRLFEFLPDIVDAVRVDGASKLGPDLLASSAGSVARQCGDFLTNILDNNSARDVLIDVVEIQKRNEILLSLIGAVSDYVKTIEAAGAVSPDSKFGRLLFALGESLHTILAVANDAFLHKDRRDLDLLREFTSDRSTQMERVRRQVMEVEDIGPAEHDTLYASTTLFERTLWLLQRYMSLVEGPKAAE